MVSQQANSPVIRASNQAMIRNGGEQGDAATRVAYQRVAGLLPFRGRVSHV
jgi:hypothetical protein